MSAAEKLLQRWRRCGGLLLGTVVQRETGAHACGRAGRCHGERDGIRAAAGRAGGWAGRRTAMPPQQQRGNRRRRTRRQRPGTGQRPTRRGQAADHAKASWRIPLPAGLPVSSLNLSLPGQDSPSPAPSSGPGPVALACCLRRLALAHGPPRVPVRWGWLPVARSASGTPWRAPRLGVWGTSGRGARWHGMGARSRQKRPFEFPILRAYNNPRTR